MFIWTASVPARRLLRAGTLMSEPEARGPEDHDRASHADGDAIFDFGDSGRAPGGAFGFLPLGPRPDRALQDHLAAVGFDGDAVGVELRVAAKGILDLAPDLGGSHAGLEDNQVADAPDALDPQHRVLRAGALVVPLGASFERQPAVLATTFMFSEEYGSSALRAATASRTISGSGRSVPDGRWTAISLAMPTTPETRFTSASAS